MTTASEPSADGRVADPQVGMRVYFYRSKVEGVAQLYVGEIVRINRKTVDVQTSEGVVRTYPDRLLYYNPLPWDPR